jgi:23S rRNA (pseudouridine1915-N3)-methyltransferase
VGKDKGETAALVEEYGARIRRFAQLELVELKAAGPEREADALLAKVRGELWALDQRGVELTSRELAERVSKTASFSLCIGGDEGLAPPIRKEARLIWSLSRLTLPHRLARVVALEQLYRAFEILRGGPYHKE